MRWLVHVISRSLALLSAGAAALMMVAIAIDVGRREFIGRPVPGANELTILLIVLVIFLGLAEAERTDIHVRMRLVTSRVPPRVAQGMRAVALLLTVGLLMWFAYATGLRAYRSFLSGEYQFGLSRFPIWPARSLIPLGFLGVALETLLRAVDAARGALGLSAIEDPGRGWSDESTDAASGGVMPL